MLLVQGAVRESAKAMRSSSGIPRCRPWEGRRLVLRQADQGDGSDPALVDDGVQPPNESRRTAPPEETAADHTVHVEEGRRLLQITLLRLA
jgi:hypothetical protein